MTRFGFDPIYGSPLAALLCAVAVVAVIAWVTPPTPKPTQRRWLIGLRSFAALLLMLTAFGPSLIRTDNQPADATLVVAADVSKSMTLSDGEGSDRWSTQMDTWQTLAKGLSGLDDSLKLHFMVYDGSARQVVACETLQQIADSGTALQSEAPEGDATDLSFAIESAIQSAAGQPLAGVVLMGDGTQTATRQLENNRGAGAQQFAEILDSLGVPFWTVPIGPPASDNSSRDVAVDTLPEVFQLFSGNQFNVPFELSLRGLANTEIEVELIWQSTDGTETTAATRRRATQKSNDVVGMVVPLTAPEPGAYRLTVQAKPQAGEWVTSNNTQTAFVEVREGGGRIFYAEGAQRPEQTFLTRSLRRFPDLELSYQWIRPNQKWPVDLGSVFEPGHSDIYILGDLDASALGTEQLTKLAERVAEGSGLVTLGGFQAYESGGYATSPIADVLPIQMDPAALGGKSGDSADRSRQLTGPVEIELAKTHPITNLGGDAPQDVWKQLSPLSGANRIAGRKIAAGVQVLLQTPEGNPLLVVGGHGRGRVASLAFDETYRWWRSGNSEAHRRFWRQLVLWLLSREETGDDKVIVQMDSRRFGPDAKPGFTARVSSVSSDAGQIPLVAEVVDAADVATPLVARSIATSNEESSLAGEISTLPPGFYRLRVRPEDESSKVEPGELAFQVIEESRELARPLADPVYLKQLADLTSDHGGGAYRPDQMDELLQQIAQRRKKAETPIVEKNRLGDGPISGWIVFTLFAGALGIEWFLRRRWSLA